METKAEAITFMDHCPVCNLAIPAGFEGSAMQRSCPRCGELYDSRRWSRKDMAEGDVVLGSICNECLGWMEKGIICISIQNGEGGAQNPTRTGDWTVVSEEGIKTFLLDQLLQEVMRSRMLFVEDEIWTKVGLPRANVPPATSTEVARKE